jgi:hypothetical protein
MIRYRIYTERVKVPEIEAAVKSKFDGATMYNGTGIWRGEVEGNPTIEIVSLDFTLAFQQKVAELAAEIKRIGNQESVMVTAEPVEVKFI